MQLLQAAGRPVLTVAGASTVETCIIRPNYGNQPQTVFASRNQAAAISSQTFQLCALLSLVAYQMPHTISVQNDTPIGRTSNEGNYHNTGGRCRSSGIWCSCTGIGRWSCKKIEAYVASNIRGWLMSDEIIKAVDQQNIDHLDLTAKDI
jgi:hypothetical protein